MEISENYSLRISIIGAYYENNERGSIIAHYCDIELLAQKFPDNYEVLQT
ncbi:hypothetical protein J4456_00440 [Candidatus Pacearchaeota archaeon]|nr:hypothetical protein [Candidatus Pacearchaeota archaeon]